MLRIIFSNRFESLVEKLLDNLHGTSSHPFACDQIITANAAVRRRLKLDIARRYRVCSNVDFPFLSQWMAAQIGGVTSGAGSNPYTADPLSWRVLNALEDAAFTAQYPRLQSYVRQSDAVMRYELACSIATLFEQYLTYRPDWIAAWQGGKDVAVPNADDAWCQDQGWQGALWRRLAAELAAADAGTASVFFDRLTHGQLVVHPPAARTVSVFGLPSVPPLFFAWA